MVRDYLIVFRICQNYIFWYFHGETRSLNERNGINVDTDDEDDKLDDEIYENQGVGENDVNNEINEEIDQDDQFMEDIINDLYPTPEASNNEHPVDDANKFYWLLDDSKLPFTKDPEFQKPQPYLNYFT